jgi:transposase
VGYITKEFNRNQLNLIPLSFDEMIDDNNVVRVIDAFVEMLDISNFSYSNPKSTGRPPYNPKDMLKLYVYGYFNGIRTSRKLEKECKRNIELMWLLNNLTPDDKTISDFRKDNKKAVISTFKQFSILCQELNLIGKEIVAIDGSKFRACNSRHKNFTKNKVAKMLKHYDECAKRYMELLESNEPIVDNNDLNKKLEKALNRIKELNEMANKIDETGEISITDPDSRHMSVSNNGTDISHNIQTAVDEKNHLIVAVDVTSNAQDNGQLVPMAEKAKEELGVEKITVIADKGYYNGKCLKHCQENGIKAIVSKQKAGIITGDENYAKDKFIYNKEKDVFICPQGHELKCVSSKSSKQIKYKTKECKQCPFKESCTTSERGREIVTNEYFEIYQKADELFAENLDLYKKRQMIVEHPFGTIKRAFGYTYFLTRGHENVKNESYLHCLTYNLKRVINIMGITPLLYAIKRKMAKQDKENTSVFYHLAKNIKFCVEFANYWQFRAGLI